MSETVAMWLIGLALTALVWAVRQEGRVNAHDRELNAHAKRHDELRDDISYIRERIDSALNGRR